MTKSSHRVVRLAISLLVMALIPTVCLADQAKPGFQIIATDPGLSLHKEMFMLPVTFSSKYHGRKTEAVFQISAKYRLFNSRLYFGYTQISFWQAYDHKNSAPFRETNYNPELFYRTRLYPFSRGHAGADIGFEHESNGQIPPVSRSWNLLYFSPYYTARDLLVYGKFRYRIPEKDKASPLDAEGDDNPDITDYLGYSDVHLYYALWKSQRIHLMVRGNVATGMYGMVLNYSARIPGSTTSYFFLRFSQGYGESLVDYKKSLTRVGIGFAFVR